MGDKAIGAVNAIIRSLKEGPKSINQLAEVAEIEWRTATSYLEMMKKEDIVEERPIGNTRTFFFKDNKNFFKLPVIERDQKIISTIYNNIKKFCKEIYQKEPTNTQVYKILWKINKDETLNLPIGWYRYGPICIQVYKGDENDFKNLTPKQITKIKKITEEYCKLNTDQLQKVVYSEANEELYLAKKDVLAKVVDSQNKQELSLLFMNLLKYVPKETIETTTDYIRASLLLGPSIMMPHFETLWKYIAMVVLRESIHGKDKYYDFDLEPYFDKEIDLAKKDIQETIYGLVNDHVSKKYPKRTLEEQPSQ